MRLLSKSKWEPDNDEPATKIDLIPSLGLKRVILYLAQFIAHPLPDKLKVTEQSVQLRRAGKHYIRCIDRTHGDLATCKCAFDEGSTLLEMGTERKTGRNKRWHVRVRCTGKHSGERRRQIFEDSNNGALGEKERCPNPQPPLW